MAAQNPSVIPIKLPTQYEKEIRTLFKNRQWEDGKVLLDQAEPEYGTLSVFYELKGIYFLNTGQADKARSCFLLAVRDEATNTNALLHLVKLERECGNYSTAIDHVNALLEFEPYDIGLWRQKIEMYRMLHNDGEADRLLERIRTIYPSDSLLQLDYNERLLMMYSDQRHSGDSYGAMRSLEELVVLYPKDAEYHLALTNAYINQGRIADALSASANGVQRTKGNMQLIRKHVGLLMEQGNYTSAENFVKNCKRSFNTPGLASLQSYIQSERLESITRSDPYTQNARSYSIRPTEDGLRWLLNTALRNGYWEDALMYNADARKRYGDTEKLISQAILINGKLGNTAQVVRLQEQLFAMNPTNEDAANAIASRKMREAMDFMSDEQYKEAIAPLQEVVNIAQDPEIKTAAERRIATCNAVLAEKAAKKRIGDAVDSAYVLVKRKELRAAADSLDMVLAQIPDHNEALALHADVSQGLHQYDSAYTYLSKYKPLPSEVWDVRRRLHALKNRGLKNDISVNSQFMRRASNNSLNHTMTASYTHEWKKSVLDVYLGYAGRDSYDNEAGSVVGGGMGVQLGLGYTFRSGIFSIGGKVLGSNMFFPRIHAALQMDFDLPKDWTFGVRGSWRDIKNTEENYQLYSAGLNLTKTIGPVIMIGSVDLFNQSLKRNLFANGSLKIQYFPWEQERTSVSVSLGAGNAPETTIIDQSVENTFSHLNAFVGTGFNAMLTANLFLNGGISWYTMSSFNNKQVRNYLFVDTGISFRF